MSTVDTERKPTFWGKALLAGVIVASGGLILSAGYILACTLNRIDFRPDPNRIYIDLTAQQRQMVLDCLLAKVSRGG